MFGKVSDLFIEKWINLENNEKISEFLGYFRRQWLCSSKKGWYESFCMGLPSTNNAVEANNNVIKQDVTMRKRKRS